MNNTKRSIGLIGLIVLSAALILGAGCATGQQQGMFNANNPTPPTALERELFETLTNMRPQVVTQTNVVTVTVTQTNAVVMYQTNVVAGAPPVVVTLTNYVTSITYETNRVSVTNQVEGYQLTTGKGVEAAQAIGSAAAGPFGWGGIVSLILGTLASTYLSWRNRALAGNVKTGQVVAETLANNIQTLRRVIETTAQGQQLGELCKQYLIKHQGQAGVLQEVVDILDDVIDEPSALVAAQEIQRLLAQVSPPPATTTTPTAAAPKV